jgi:hypothetical protein
MREFGCWQGPFPLLQRVYANRRADVMTLGYDSAHGGYLPGAFDGSFFDLMDADFRKAYCCKREGEFQ